MTAELGTEAKRDAEPESDREVIEITSEEVEAVDEHESGSSMEGTGQAEAKAPERVEPEEDRAETTPPQARAAVEEPAPADSGKTVYCVRCGADMRPDDRFCRNCGWDSTHANGAPPPRPRAPLPPDTSERNRLTTLLLCVLLGPFGAHRFYLGKTGTGILWLMTLGFLGIGVVFDVVMIATGECRDIEGRPVLRWD